MSFPLMTEPLSNRPIQTAPAESGDHLKPHLQSVQPTLKKNKRINPLFMTLTAVIGVLAILSVQLWLNLSVSSGAYEINELVYQQRELSRSERALKLDVNMLASPQNLATEATALGMVQNSQPAYLKLAESAIAGSIVQSTSQPKANLVNNSALKDLQSGGVVNSDKKASDDKKKQETKPENSVKPVKNVAVKNQKSGVVAENDSSQPIAWKGKLAAPTTR
ncbi:MAG TPA: hypothetical protein VLZ31_07630 [Microbacteriaceae bacterium]|nr:hypothetical protein [Microbacteriaceae bacterium]